MNRTHLRRYFINHLVGVVERNARRKREVEAPAHGTQQVNVNDRSTTSAGMIRRSKALPSIDEIRRVEEVPQPILSTDWNSRTSFSFD